MTKHVDFELLPPDVDEAYANWAEELTMTGYGPDDCPAHIWPTEPAWLAEWFQTHYAMTLADVYKAENALFDRDDA